MVLGRQTQTQDTVLDANYAIINNEGIIDQNKLIEATDEILNAVIV